MSRADALSPLIPPVTKGAPSTADVFTSLPVAALLIGPDNIIADANGRAEALLNMARTAIIGSDIGRTVRIEEQNMRFQLWQSDKPLAAYDISLHAGRNASLKADVMISPLADHEGWRIATIHAQSLAQAIGGRRTAGGTRSAMGAAAILAHEIKNPLSGIRGAAQLLAGASNEGDTALTKLICDEVDRIAALIDRMQDFTTERPLECSATNIYPVLDQAIGIISAGVGQNVKITRKYDPSLPPARCNADALTQIVLNLLKNACEAVGAIKKPAVRIETAFRHGVSVMLGEGKGSAVLPIEILVIDNGPGVPSNIRDDLFNPFISTKRDGQGLGLALVDKLVRDMNGFVQHSRDEMTKETIFRILLPMAQL